MPKGKYVRPAKPTATIIKAKPTQPKLSFEEQAKKDLEEMDKQERALKDVIRNKGYKYKSIDKVINKVVGKYEPQIVHIPNMRYSGRDLISVRINENLYANRTFSINAIKKISDKLSNKLLDKGVNGKMMTALKYGDLSWKSGYLRNFGVDTVLYDPNVLYNNEVPYIVPKTIPSFNFYIALGSKPEGGDDDRFNDCLYNCLKYVIFDIEHIWKSPAVFKTFLKLGRYDKVPVDRIDMIETKLKNFQINIRGDYIRSSTIISNKHINLSLINEHYTVEKPDRVFVQWVRYEEKTPIMWDKKTFEAYDGNKKWTMTKQERNTILYNFKSPYILINRMDMGRDKDDNAIKITIEQEYNEWIQIADDLKKESKGMINLYKTGSNHDTALSLFDRLSKFINPEEILQDEAEWISMASKGAIIWAEAYKGKLYQYDVKSIYPFLMGSTSKFPVKRGEFKLIEKFSEYVEFGIYRCVIYESADKNLNRLFRFNADNYYTQQDIFNAQNLKLKIELIQDTKPNFLYYSREKLITFSEVFTQYIDLLYPLKENKVKYAKDILNILWGSLGERDKRKQYIDVKGFTIEENEMIDEIYPSNTEEDKHVIKTINLNKQYKTNFARLIPHLVAGGRRHMTNILLPYKDNVHRVLTDGFLIDTPIHFNTNDIKMGQLKYEGYTECGEIINCRNRIDLKFE